MKKQFLTCLVLLCMGLASLPNTTSAADGAPVIEGKPITGSLIVGSGGALTIQSGATINGRVGIGTENPEYTLDVNGDLRVSGQIIAPAAETYGVDWDESADTYTRTGSIAAFPAGTSPGDANLSIHAQLRRCVMNDSGEVQYYLCATDSTFKSDCSTAATLDGTDGQVMVEIPAFYYKYSYSGTTHSWSISLAPLDGYAIHPAFIKDGSRAQYRYMGAYEGSMYDDSAGAMVGDADIETGMYASGDKLCSISGQYPKTNETRAEFRAMAAERGTGWRQQDYFLTAAVQLLYLVEYADFDSQSMIGNGRTMFSNGVWEAANQGNGMYIGQTGYSNGDGNATNATDRAASLDIAAIDTTQASYQDYMVYRGIENFFGNIWSFVDGINVRNYDPLGGAAYASYAYVAQDEGDFADDTDTNYTEIAGGGLAQSDGYGASLVQTLNGFLPASVGASSSTKLCDYYYTYFDDDNNSGWRVVRFGGDANSGSAAGAFCVLTYSTSSSGYASIGGRLCF